MKADARRNHDFLRNSESVSLLLFRASSSIESMPLSLRTFYRSKESNR